MFSKIANNDKDKNHITSLPCTTTTKRSTTITTTTTTKTTEVTSSEIRIITVFNYMYLLHEICNSLFPLSDGVTFNKESTVSSKHHTIISLVQDYFFTALFQCVSNCLLSPLHSQSPSPYSLTLITSERTK